MVGGGLLNEYGRSLSREILSQPSLLGVPVTEGDERAGYGLLRTPEWLLLGGDVRLLQTFMESKKASRGRFMIMQMDLDGSAQVSKMIRVFASIGRVLPKDSDATAMDFVTSPRHGVELALTKAEDVNHVTLRFGRFMPGYGIGFVEHTLVTRQLLDFQPGQERYAAELAWADDHTSVIATGIGAQVDRAKQSRTKRETGGIIQLATALGEHAKVGANYYQTQIEAGTRRIYGAFANVGFSKTWYGLLELDKPQTPTGKWGLVEIFKVGYEIKQGLHLIGIEEFANLNTEKSNPKFDAYSAGAEWFPRPHWDLYGLYRKERDTNISNDFNDVVWLIAHFYL